MRKMANFCRTGRNVYDGIKELLLHFFNAKKTLTRNELIAKIDELRYNNGYNIYTYKTWSGSSDFLRFITIKLGFLDYLNGIFSFTNLASKFRDILISSEEKFKDELFKHTYIKSTIYATRFRDFCDFLKYDISHDGILSYTTFMNARKNILKDTQFSNIGAYYFLVDLGVIKEISKKNNIVNINLQRISLIDPFEIAMKLLKGNLNDNNKTMDLEIAKRLLNEHNLDTKLIDELYQKNRIIIRTTRSGKYIDFN